ncbi:MAG: hypothetical protein NUV80_02720 [Candidatus Berkelbacteria bacterium]|nr:hypothetical protein [Candidatus Berkelbacteria bacterium]
MKKFKFKDRYVLGKGYLWYGHDGYQIQLFDKQANGKPIPMRRKFPIGLFNTGAPKYRLVLERVK